jgi:hypothetical protein
VYSFGIILWQMYTLQELFPEYDNISDFKHAISVLGIRPTIPKIDPTLSINRSTPLSLRNLMTACWHTERRRRPSFPEIVVLLNEVLIDLYIDDKNGANFWKDYFYSQKHDLEEVIKWRDFSEALSKATGITDRSRFDILYPFIVSSFGSHNRISINDFNQAIHWVGHFFLQERAEESLQQIGSLICKYWFHGYIDQHEADGRLSSKVPGTFLVRLSKTFPWYPFTLSLPDKKHLRIKKSEGQFGERQFFLDRNGTVPVKYSSVIDLIEGIKDSFRPPLTVPCPQTPASSGYEGVLIVLDE